MIKQDALVLYKNKPAIIKEIEKDKYNIYVIDDTSVKVRGKDIELLHPGPVKNFDGFKDAELFPVNQIEKIKETWELLSEEENNELSLNDLAGFFFNDTSAVSVYGVYCILQDGLYFYNTEKNTSGIKIALRSKEEIENENTKRNEKRQEGNDRKDFLTLCKEKINKNIKLTKEEIEKSFKFIQDVEALALGKSEKSRTLKELNITETPEDAHNFLLKTGIWTNFINPYPVRAKISVSSSIDISESEIKTKFETNSKTLERIDLTYLESFAIDSPWSCDPDDAISIEKKDNTYILYVHVADPASIIKPDSPEDKEARNRGATLYLPEIIVRMISAKYLPFFALGLSDISCALTFKMTINTEAEILNTDIFPSNVKVTRISYEDADSLIENNLSLSLLNELSKKIFTRRMKNGAVDIDLPDVRITIESETINIQPYKKNISSVIVRECMIAAGEGTANWASEKGLALPYISQEKEIPNKILPGYAGSMQLRKGMRPRVISVKPAEHQGLGLNIYTQVTSPLRRYTDLLAHMQIRSYLENEKGKKDSLPQDKDIICEKFYQSEAGTVAGIQAERASNLHWKMVFLQDKKDSEWEAVAIEKKLNRWLVLIPNLALETLVTLNKDVNPNDEIKLKLKSVNIPKCEAVFIN